MTPTPMSIECLIANPDHGAIRSYVRLGTCMAISVPTLLRVCVGMVMF